MPVVTVLERSCPRQDPFLLPGPPLAGVGYKHRAPLRWSSQHPLHQSHHLSFWWWWHCSLHFSDKECPGKAPSHSLPLLTLQRGQELPARLFMPRHPPRAVQHLLSLSHRERAVPGTAGRHSSMVCSCMVWRGGSQPLTLLSQPAALLSSTDTAQHRLPGTAAGLLPGQEAFPFKICFE